MRFSVLFCGVKIVIFLCLVILGMRFVVCKVFKNDGNWKVCEVLLRWVGGMRRLLMMWMRLFLKMMLVLSKV